MKTSEYLAVLDEIGELRTDAEAVRFDQRVIDRFRGQPGLEDLRSAVVNHRDALAAVRATGN